ncbi:MAG: hypothetical protein DCC71_10225 [Proteobacteria bacterium]|nr:MAG: hypothetical protein DCC71_10225 [Pseudomonadota bacterium]
MRIAVFDADADLSESLAALLRGRGHAVDRRLHDEAPDLVIVGLPAPSGLTPDALPAAPLLLLLGWPLPLGEIERWAGATARWAVLWKPAPERAIETAISRIERPLVPLASHEADSPLRFGQPPRR